MKMAYQVVRADHWRSEWPILVRVAQLARNTPFSSFFNHMRSPIATREDYYDLVKQELHDGKTTEIVKAVDMRTGEIVGCAAFNICLDQIASTSMLRRPSLAIGNETEKVLKDKYLATPRAAPHVFWNSLSTLPGLEDEVTPLLIDWGINRAANLGVEMWHYTLQPSAPLYGIKGFQAATERVIGLEAPSKASWPKDGDNEAEKRNGAEFSCWGMWRPAPST
ncbi:hypothetical protein BDV96DRAFT_564366 [Lophiotrema nucula]|uniref:N-acetyltransferase domain-containing protein n=1 Tax=Lophiotrema nucula TaxID=690887 RepID=A0A6A5ZQF4_9PLEO|nr:hypothetical protein BDV96DRAFT_564366 [Lophiotrema nucula]